MRVHECKTIFHVRTGERNKQKEKTERKKGEGKRKIKEVNIKEKMKISVEIFPVPPLFVVESLLIFAHDKFPDDYTATFLLDSTIH